MRRCASGQARPEYAGASRLEQSEAGDSELQLDPKFRRLDSESAERQSLCQLEQRLEPPTQSGLAVTGRVLSPCCWRPGPPQPPGLEPPAESALPGLGAALLPAARPTSGRGDSDAGPSPVCVPVHGGNVQGGGPQIGKSFKFTRPRIRDDRDRCCAVTYESWACLGPRAGSGWSGCAQSPTRSRRPPCCDRGLRGGPSGKTPP